MKRVIVHIDRVVLKGFHAEERQQIAEGLQTELGRLLKAPGVAEQLVSLRNQPRVLTGSIGLPQEGKPTQFGGSVASEIVRSFSR